MVVGDAGLGKTTLIRTLLAVPNERIEVWLVKSDFPPRLLPSCTMGPRQVLSNFGGIQGLCVLEFAGEMSKTEWNGTTQSKIRQDMETI